MLDSEKRVSANENQINLVDSNKYTTLSSKPCTILNSNEKVHRLDLPHYHQSLLDVCKQRNDHSPFPYILVVPTKKQEISP